MLKVKTDYLPLGHPNRPGIKLYGVKARVWHGTANLNSTAGDEMHRSYMGRAYTKKWDSKLGKYEYFETDGRSFVFGGAHVFIDKDSATIMVPLDEVVWGCGDRPSNYNNGYKGQTRLAKEVFGNQNNYYTWNIELCMNDMSAWDKVLSNAIEFVQTYMPKSGIEDYRHYDMTGKICPSPMVDSLPGVCPSWVLFRERIKKALLTPSIPDGVPIIRVNGEVINNKMDVQPEIKDGRIMVPVRFIAEALGKQVTWIANEKIADIR